MNFLIEFKSNIFKIIPKVHLITKYFFKQEKFIQFELELLIIIMANKLSIKKCFYLRFLNYFEVTII